jgi:hypothetical protein
MASRSLEETRKNSQRPAAKLEPRETKTEHGAVRRGTVEIRGKTLDTRQRQRDLREAKNQRPEGGGAVGRDSGLSNPSASTEQKSGRASARKRGARN